MTLIRLALLFLLFFPGIDTCHAEDDSSALLSLTSTTDKTVTLLFTNDVESAYDPAPAFWLDDISMIGGIAEMTTLIRTLRLTEPNVFRFDSGDIFTGALVKLTQGKLAVAVPKRGRQVDITPPVP